MWKPLGPHLAAAAAGQCWKGLWSQDRGLSAGLSDCAAVGQRHGHGSGSKHPELIWAKHLSQGDLRHSVAL